MGDTKTLFTRLKIHQYFANGRENKAYLAENGGKRFKQVLTKYIAATGDYEWVSKVHLFEHHLNSKYNKKRKCSPISIDVMNQEIVYNNLIAAYNKIVPKHKSKLLEVGMHVKVKLVKGPFEKGYTQTYSSQIYEISQVSHYHKLSTYKLKSLNSDEPIQGFWYSWQLLQIQ